MTNLISYCQGWIRGTCGNGLNDEEIIKYCEDLAKDIYPDEEFQIEKMTTWLYAHDSNVGTGNFCKRFSLLAKQSVKPESCENASLLVPLAVVAVVLGIVAAPMALEVLAGGAIAAGMTMWMTGE